MPRLRNCGAGKLTNLGAVVIPFLATHRGASSALGLWLVSWHHLALFAGSMHLVTAAGITVGFHRLLPHRSFRTHKPTESVIAAQCRAP